MTSRGAEGPVAVCVTCGKRSYVSKTSAKRALRRLYPGERMSVYPCGDVYHFGHLPKAVLDGEASRMVFRPTTNRRSA